MLMLPKARSPIVRDPTLPREGVSVAGTENHSFCPWLEEQFQNEMQNSMAGEKIVQQQTLLLQTVLLRVASETVRLVISHLFPFFFWLLAKSHSKAGMFAVGQDLGSAAARGSARSCAQLSRHHIPLASAAAGNVGMGKQGRRSYLTYK